jgi:hypothetical protein
MHIDRQVMVARQPHVESILSSNLVRHRLNSTTTSHNTIFKALLEEQLSDGREWLFDTELPSLADISVYFIYSWIQLFWKKGLFDTQKFPKSLEVNPSPLPMNGGDWRHVDSGYLVALSFLSIKELLALKRQNCLAMMQLSSSLHRFTSHTT